MENVYIFRIPVSRLPQDAVVEQIIALANERRQRGVRPAAVATLNVDFVANAVGGWPFKGNLELWNYLKHCDLVTADGMPIVLLSRLLRKPIAGRATGADMVPALCRRAAEEGLSVYVLGGSQDSLATAFEKIIASIPHEGAAKGLRVAGLDPAFVKLDCEDPAILERVNAVAPDILFVALGNPKQELWIGRHLGELRAGVVMGVGGTFNFIAGKVRRAPRWMQRCGLEWIYRIVQEPDRLWRRYAYGLVKFSWLSLIHLLGGYRK